MAHSLSPKDLRTTRLRLEAQEEKAKDDLYLVERETRDLVGKFFDPEGRKLSTVIFSFSEYQYHDRKVLQQMYLLDTEDPIEAFRLFIRDYPVHDPHCDQPDRVTNDCGCDDSMDPDTIRIIWQGEATLLGLNTIFRPFAGVTVREITQMSPFYTGERKLARVDNFDDLAEWFIECQDLNQPSKHKHAARRRRYRPDNVRAENPDQFQIFIKHLEGGIKTLDVRSTNTIKEVKQLLVDAQLGSIEMRLIFAGKQVEDDFTLEHYGIEKECTLHQCNRLRGGNGFPIPEINLPAENPEYRAQAQTALQHMPAGMIPQLTVQVGWMAWHLFEVNKQLMASNQKMMGIGRELERDRNEVVIQRNQMATERTQMMDQGNQILAQLQEMQKHQQQWNTERDQLKSEVARLKKKLKSAIPDPTIVRPNQPETARIIAHEETKWSDGKHTDAQMLVHHTVLGNKVNKQRAVLVTAVHAMKEVCAQKFAIERLISTRQQQVQQKEAAKDEMHQLRLEEQRVKERKRQVQAQQWMGGSLMPAAAPSSLRHATSSPSYLMPAASVPLLCSDEPADSMDIEHTDNEEESEDEETDYDREFAVADGTD